MNALLIVLTLAAGQAESEPPKKPLSGVEIRKQARDAVLKSLGDGDRDATLAFTKKYREVGVQALQRCKPETGRALVNLHRAGAMDNLKDPRAVLIAVEQHGQVAAEWLVNNIERLADPQALSVWCKYTPDVVYDLIDLEAVAAEARAESRVIPKFVGKPDEWNGLHLAVVVLIALLATVLVWKRNRPIRP